MMALSAHVPAYRIHHSWRINGRRETGNRQTGVKFGHSVVVRVVVVVYLVRFVTGVDFLGDCLALTGLICYNLRCAALGHIILMAVRDDVTQRDPSKCLCTPYSIHWPCQYLGASYSICQPCQI